MGILNDLKKIFFGAEALSKSAMNKGKEMAESSADHISKEILEKTSGLKDAITEKAGEAMVKHGDLINKAKDSLDDISDKAESLGENLIEKAGKTFEEIKESDSLKKASSTLNDISEQVQTKASELSEKASEKVGDLSEAVGTTVFGENNERLDKLKDITESIGDKVLDAKDEAVKKAKELKDDIDDKIDETLEKAKEAEAKEKFEKEQRAKTPPTAHGDSTLEGTDDFFSKAEKYAQGDYTVFSEGQITIDKSKTDITSTKSNSKAAGFEDLDGDGNEIIDDAIIDDNKDIS